MSKIFKGIVSFVNYEKQFVTIAYNADNKSKAKTINGLVSLAAQKPLIEKGAIKKMQTFYKGDTVQFITKHNDEGNKMVAADIQYLYNEALDVVINKAKTKNDFIGYLKEVNEAFFIKEVSCARFFKVATSPWQMPFTVKQLTETVVFSLINIEKKEKALAVIAHTKMQPYYIEAEKMYKAKKVIDAQVTKITDFGAHVGIVNNAIQAKITDDGKIRLNQIIQVRISFLSPMKIVLERVSV
jgi:flagellin-like hook-associated protein FlgL